MKASEIGSAPSAESATPPVTIYKVGLCASSVCVDRGLSRAEIERAVNEQEPTGIGPWTISDAPTFANGPTNPCVCELDPGRLHYLMEPMLFAETKDEHRFRKDAKP